MSDNLLDVGEIKDHAISDIDKDNNKPDYQTEKESEDLGKQERSVKIDDLKQNKELRKTYARRIFWLLSLWLIGIFVIIIFQGFLSPWKIFNLDDSVLLAAIGGTTINVIGIFVVVTRYLFHRSAE